MGTVFIKFNRNWPTKKEIKTFFKHICVNVGNVENNGYKNNARNFLFLNINFLRKLPAL